MTDNQRSTLAAVLKDLARRGLTVAALKPTDDGVELRLRFTAPRRHTGPGRTDEEHER